VLEAELAKQRRGVGVTATGVHRGQRMVETIEQQVVDGGEEHHRLVCLRWSLAHHCEELVVACDRAADPLVER